MAELRVYLKIEQLRRQFAAYMGTPTRARGYPPLAGQHSLIIEVAPGLMIERVLDIALKADRSSSPASCSSSASSASSSCTATTRFSCGRSGRPS